MEYFWKKIVALFFLLTFQKMSTYVVSSQYWTLEIKTFSLGSRIQDVEVSGLKNHNFLS